MAWFNKKGSESDVVISSRIRLARNIADYPFASLLSSDTASKLIHDVADSLNNTNCKQIDFNTLSNQEAQSYVEKHYVSPEFASNKLPRSLFLDDEKNIAIMVCEEDHIRLQSIVSGFDLETAYKNANEYDDIISSKLNIAFDEELGYLSHCPTNLGTGMRASLMVFLPALTATNQIGRLSVSLSKLGLTLRGIYGEGTNGDGAIYQISNQITMGITEEDTIKKLSDIVSQVIASERKLRQTIKSDNFDKLCDRCMRSLGILKSAHMISTNEAMKLLADVRMGVSLGFIKNIDYDTLTSIMVNIQPATLIVSSGKELDPSARDIIRAKYLKEEMKQYDQ